MKKRYMAPALSAIRIHHTALLAGSDDYTVNDLKDGGKDTVSSDDW